MLGGPELASFQQTLRKWLYLSAVVSICANGGKRRSALKACTHACLVRCLVGRGDSIMGRT